MKHETKTTFLNNQPPQFSPIGCVIMASGEGKRFGGNKLMADFGGKPMIWRALVATEGIFYRRIVVTRHIEVAQLCRQLGVEVLLHDLPHRSDTVRLGITAVEGEVERCMFFPGDQPLLRRETVWRMVQTGMDEKNNIWRASYGEEVGSPVIFPRWAFEELKRLPTGKGGGVVITHHPDQVSLYPVENEWELKDADTPEELEGLVKIRKEGEEKQIPVQHCAKQG